MFADITFTTALEQSALLALSAACLAWLLSLIVVYMLPRQRPSRHGERSDIMVVSVMFSVMAATFPLALLVSRSAFLDPQIILGLAYLLAVVPFCSWQIRRSLSRVPPELFDAAEIDGGTRGQIFRHVILPVIAPSLIVGGMTLLIVSWSFLAVFPRLLRIGGSATGPWLVHLAEPTATIVAAGPIALLLLILLGYFSFNARSSSRATAL